MTVALVVGCQTYGRPGGSSGAPAVENPVAEAQPSGVDVPTAIAAADRALSRAGYVIKKKRSTLSSGVVVGVAPARGIDRVLADRVIIEARRKGAGTSIVVRVQPIASPATAGALLRDTLEALGAS